LISVGCIFGPCFTTFFVDPPPHRRSFFSFIVRAESSALVNGFTSIFFGTKPVAFSVFSFVITVVVLANTSSSTKISDFTSRTPLRGWFASPSRMFDTSRLSSDCCCTILKIFFAAAWNVFFGFSGAGGVGNELSTISLSGQTFSRTTFSSSSNSSNSSSSKWSFPMLAKYQKSFVCSSNKICMLLFGNMFVLV